MQHFGYFPKESSTALNLFCVSSWREDKRNLQECTVRLVGERITGKCGFTVENSSWLLRLFATFSFVNMFLLDWDDFDWVANSFGGKFEYSASSTYCHFIWPKILVSTLLYFSCFYFLGLLSNPQDKPSRALGQGELTQLVLGRLTGGNWETQ